MKFRIHLKSAHDKLGVSFYKVSKDTGVSHNTVQKYGENLFVESPYLPSVVTILADYYGVDWRDPAVVEVIKVTENV